MRAPSCSVCTALLFVFLLPVFHAFTLRSPDDVVRRIRRQTVRRGEQCQIADIIFVVDSSGSIGRDNWEKVLNFTSTIVDDFQVGTDNVRFGMVIFGNDASIIFDLNTHNTSREVKNEISKVEWMDSTTNTAEGLEYMYSRMFTPAKGDRPNVPNIAICITDGKPNRRVNETKQQADLARAKGITIFAIGIGNEISNKTLAEIANVATSPNEQYVFSAQNFDALPNIRAQVVTAACESAAQCREDLDLVIIMDESGSIRVANYDRMKTFVVNLLDNFNVAEDKTHVGVLTFGSQARLQFHMNKHTTRTDVQNAVSTITYERGTTNTAAALRFARENMFRTSNGGRANMKNVIVLFTDGGSDDFGESIREARQTRLEGITILVVAITKWVNTYEINEIATDPDAQNVLNVANFNNLDGIVSRLKRAICNDADECSNQPCINGGTCQDAINTYLCRCPSNFAGVNCEVSCPNAADLVVSLDSSPSIGRKDFYTSLDFIKGLSRVLNIGETRTRMAVQTFSRSPTVQFHLSRYGNKQEVVNGISFPYISEPGTNTAEALRGVNRDMFSSTNGDRSNVQNFLLMITDGNSNDVVDTYQEAVNLRSTGTFILPVGIDVKNLQGRQELRGLGSDPNSENVNILNSMADLNTLYNPLVARICNNVNECSTRPCQSGGVCRDLINRYRCDCPSGVTGINCQRRCDGVYDVIFAIDDSGSIRENRYELVKQFVVDVIDQLEVRPGRVRVGVVTFNDNPNIRFHLNKYQWKEDVKQAVSILPYSRGRTNIADTLRVVRDQMFNSSNGDRQNAPNFLILLTDGQPTVNVQNTLPQAITTRIAGIQIVTVTVEIAANDLVLQGITSTPLSNNQFNVRTFNQMSTVRENVVAAMCNDRNECSPNPCQNGAACTDALGYFICRCPDEFSGERCERRCNVRQDVVFVIDSSGSVETSFRLSMALARQIAAGLNYNGGRTRVGAVTWSDTAVQRFRLNQYTTRQAVLNALYFDYTRGRTNTAAGLLLARDTAFSTNNGNRPGDRNIAIVMSDGNSNINTRDTSGRARDLQQSARVIAVGVGSAVNTAEINTIATNPDTSNAFFISDQNQVTTIANRILDSICQP